MENEVHSFYGNRLRLRACGICIKEDSILMVNHKGISEGNFWSPPGGGIQFGEHAAECVQREFAEETGTLIGVKRFLFACELIKLPLHAIELFFEVEHLGGQMKTGTDPEPGGPALIGEVKFLKWNEIKELPALELHRIFTFIVDPPEIINLRGFFRI